MLKFDAEWERSTTGTPEDRACFGEISIAYGDLWLTEAVDGFVKRTRKGGLLSGCRMAEWLAANWWRLRWEPRRDTPDWRCSHQTAAIGGGYVWPNITVFSDGPRVALIARPTAHNPREPVRYIADIPAVVPAKTFENAVDGFLTQILGQLHAESLHDANVERLWNAVCEERADAETATLRRLEASLGFDPDEGDEALLDRLTADAETLGGEAVVELARVGEKDALNLSRDALNAAANRFVHADPSAAARLPTGAVLALPRIGAGPAWERAKAAARALREQEKLGVEPLENSRLAALAGVSAAVWTADVSKNLPISFTLDDGPNTGRMALRSPRETSRRFDVARLLGDRIAAGVVRESLRPATGAPGYRQKLQKAFATELLCPFDAVEAMADGDYSAERSEEIADHFQVSPLTVRASLANHKRIARDDVEMEFAA